MPFTSQVNEECCPTIWICLISVYECLSVVTPAAEFRFIRVIRAIRG